MTNKELWEIANRERLWLTAEEFLANIKAHTATRLKGQQAPRKPFHPGSFVREYRLRDGNWIFKPKVKVPIAPKLEVVP